MTQAPGVGCALSGTRKMRNDPLSLLHSRKNASSLMSTWAACGAGASWCRGGHERAGVGDWRRHGHGDAWAGRRGGAGRGGGC